MGPVEVSTVDALAEASRVADAEGEPEDERETGPLRRCIVTREQGERVRMIRFVLGPDRLVVPDLAARLPGRGMWLSARRDVVETARTRGAFARAARGAVTLPPDLPAVLQAGLARRIGDLLGFARRAGQAVAGFQKAREWVQTGRAGLVVQASDGSLEERARFLGAHRVGAGQLGAVAPLSATELGAVFGRDHVVHVAVARGRLAESIAIETERLAGIAGQDGQGRDGSGRKIERAGA